MLVHTARQLAYAQRDTPEVGSGLMCCLLCPTDYRNVLSCSVQLRLGVLRLRAHTCPSDRKGLRTRLCRGRPIVLYIHMDWKAVVAIRQSSCMSQSVGSTWVLNLLVARVQVVRLHAVSMHTVGCTCPRHPQLARLGQ